MSAAESSSRAGEDSGAEPERSWVALVSTPRILDTESERARAMAHRTAFEFDLVDARRLSYLVLHPRIVAPDSGNVARILAADRTGRLLLRVSNPGAGDTMFLCNAHTLRAITLPPVPYSLLGIEARPRRSFGLIPDPRRRGEYMVAQLHPRDSALVSDRVLCYSTATFRWFLKTVDYSAPATRSNPCGETRVLAHEGRLYWLSLASGVFVCDPFAEPSHLRFVPLPDECEVWEEEELSEIKRANVAQRRRVAPSEGHLRYVEIRGLSYDLAPDVAPPPPVNASVRMWTLVDPEAAQPWWFEDELEVPFAEIWAHESYADFGLPDREVPHVALIDPDNHRVVYFLLGSCLKLYGLDLQARKVVSCEDCPPVRDDGEIMLRNSRPIIDAWEWSPPTPSSPGPGDQAAQHREWVALSSVAVVLGVRDHRAGLITLGAADLQLDQEKPPSPSYLILPDRFAPDPRCQGFALVVAVASDHLLVRATQGEGLQRAAYFLANVPARTLTRLPEAPDMFRPEASRCIGLIANALRVDQYVVVQLHPGAEGSHEWLVTYSTATDRWSVKKLNSAPEHGRWRTDTVVSHKEMLWWVDMSRGLLFCDPVLNHPDLRFFPLPDACQALDAAHLHQRRMVRESNANLHLVEVAAGQDVDEQAVVRIWTVNQEGQEPVWTLKHVVYIADIAGVPQDVVPPLAILDPNHAGTVSFFYGPSLVTVDLCTSAVVASCDDFWVDRSLRLPAFQKSSFVHAWVPGLNGRKMQSLQGGKSVAVAEPNSEDYATKPEARYQHALGKVRDKLNQERRPNIRQKLLQERKYLWGQMEALRKSRQK